MKNILIELLSGILALVIILAMVWIVLVDIGNGKISAGPLKTERVLAIEERIVETVPEVDIREGQKNENTQSYNNP